MKKVVAAVAVGGGIAAGAAYFDAPTYDGDLDDSKAMKWQVYLLRSLPTRILSRTWGAIHDIELPVSMRAPLYNLWTVVFDCKQDEMLYPLEHYKNLGEFFARPLKDGMRPICSEGMVSPVDGRVLHFGEIRGSAVEQVEAKGIRFSLPKFLGVPLHGLEEESEVKARAEKKKRREEEEKERKKEEKQAELEWLEQYLPASITTHVSGTLDTVREGVKAATKVVADPSSVRGGESEGEVQHKRLFFITLYLAPGDYHNYHAPVDMVVEKRNHFAGELLPVAPSFAQFMPGLFDVNERVALLGKWKEGFFSYTAVGALNVGSILIHFDKDFVSNEFRPKRPMEGHGSGDTKHYKEPVALAKGEEVGGFRLGSTVILIFEAHEGFTFNVERGQKVKVGERIA